MEQQPHSDKPQHPVHIKRKIIRLVVWVFVWLGLAVIYYTIFSFFFETPVEHGMRQSLVQLEEQYTKLSERYDTLEQVLTNISDRDKNVFRTLYDSEPLIYDESDRYLRRMDSLLGLTNQELAYTLISRLEQIEETTRRQTEEWDTLQNRILRLGTEINHIPSIQPVIDPDLTQIATSFGMRIHPFYRTMVMHNGMDYAVPEDTRVFATADGTVTRAGGGQSNSGVTLIIDHGNGYETSYHHLNRVLVRQGAKVRRGDIVAVTGNTGLSLAPHLHYEVRLGHRRIDPVHYFFYELDPEQYDRVKRQASVGMQAFD